jgi:hypothetical protein
MTGGEIERDHRTPAPGTHELDPQIRDEGNVIAKGGGFTQGGLGAL